jgi:hypothetical protein
MYSQKNLNLYLRLVVNSTDHSWVLVTGSTQVRLMVALSELTV